MTKAAAFHSIKEPTESRETITLPLDQLATLNDDLTRAGYKLEALATMICDAELGFGDTGDRLRLGVQWLLQDISDKLGEATDTLAGFFVANASHKQPK